MEEALHPAAKGLLVILGELARQNLQAIGRRALISDGQSFDDVEHRVGHQVAFVGLIAALGAELGRGRLHVDRMECGDRLHADGALGFEPAKPLSQERFVDAGDRAQAAAGVAVHRRVADCRLGAIAGREQQCAPHVGQHPHARAARTSLDVLQRDVVLIPGEGTPDCAADQMLVRIDDVLHVEDVERGTDRLGHGGGRAAGDLAAVVGRLVGAA